MTMIERCRGAYLLAVCAVALGGCANYFSANVTAFQDWRGSDADRTYRFERTPAQENDLEQEAYEALVDQELSTLGFRRVGPPSTRAPEREDSGTPRAAYDVARYDVSLTYGQRETVAYAPQFVDYGGWGFGAAWGRGAWGGRGAFGPGVGLAPIVDMPYAAVVSQLTLRIRERPDGREVYKVSARHEGERTALPVVMPYLVRSALFDFPMPNGTSREVRMPLDGRGARSAAVR